MCKAGGKEFRFWYRLESTKELIEALKSDVMISTSQLVDIKKGNSAQFEQGSWIHPDLAVQLAQWISPLFAIQVGRWVRELAITGEVKLERERTNEDLLIMQKNIKQLENKHQSVLLRRNYHKFKKGPVFYVISDPDSQVKRYKIGIANDDFNERLSQYRTSIPNIRVNYLVYTEKNNTVEQSLLSRYEYARKPHLNHEWLHDVALDQIISSCNTLLEFISADHTVEDELDKYNS